MTFVSLLFADSLRPDESAAAEPQHFGDLALDRIVTAATVGRDNHNLRPLWHLPLDDPDLIAYRQAVFADLDNPAVHRALVRFADGAEEIGRELSPRRRSATSWQARRWRLNAAARYCETIADLADALPVARPRSQALTGLTTWLADHVTAEAFTTLRRDVADTLERLQAINYNILLRGLHVTVEPFDGEADLTALVDNTFERFRRAPRREFPGELRNPYLDPIAAQVSELVARLFPDEHAQLERFATVHAQFIDPTIDLLARELQFYLGYLALLAPLHEAGLSTTLPRIVPRGRFAARDTFDLALATSLVSEDTDVVRNDIGLDGAERILVISGPNQGGKTTMARTIGQLYYLAGLGCPVAGTQACLALPDNIYAHFERQEDVRTLSGKLEDDLVRIHAILDGATADSVVILNEIFSSTTLEDARLLSAEVLTRLTGIDAVCVCVTFIDELSRLNDTTVSVVATVDENDPAIRTLRLVRRVADGRAYALALARKYGLTYEQIAGTTTSRPEPADRDLHKEQP